MEMKAFVDRHFGQIKGAYWAPAASGLNAANMATAFLGVNGVAMAFGPNLYSIADMKEAGKTIAPEIIAALQTAILEAMKRDQEKQSRPVEKDEYGNIKGDEE